MDASILKTNTEAFFSYLKYEKRLTNHSFISYQNDLTQFLSFCDENQFDLTESTTVRTWIMQLSSLEIRSNSINRKISSLNTFFNFLLSKNLISISPMENIQSLKTPQKIPTFVLDENVQTLLSNYEQENLKENYELFREYLILELLYGTGLRLSELINITLHDFDENNRILTVIGKGNKERKVPLHTYLFEKMKLFSTTFHHENQKFFFVTNNNLQLYPKFVYRLVNNALSKVTTQKKKSPHVMRHSFATEMLNNGAELNTIKDILGHSNLAATQIYTHNSIEHLKKSYRDAFEIINKENDKSTG